MAPAALALLHGRLPVGAPVRLIAPASRWSADALADVAEGAGFAVPGRPRRRGGDLTLPVLRARTLADSVGPGMRLLVVGLNPSLTAADVGVGYAGPGNRFWPAALAAGLVRRGWDPWRALATDRLGLTDLVKRATPAADALGLDEYERGFARVQRLAAWLEPQAVCLVGLAGWRAVVDRRAAAGPQPVPVGGRPCYLAPSTSGRNAHTRLPELAAHLEEAGRLADRSGAG